MLSKKTIHNMGNYDIRQIACSYPYAATHQLDIIYPPPLPSGNYKLAT